MTNPANPSPLTFTVEATCPGTAARAATLVTPHGPVKTPVFMPVGTQGAVKAVHPRPLRELGAQIVLGNAYHLYLRPGHRVVEQFGGLARFSTWDGPMLTDSGGFQVFSLADLRKMSDDKVVFRSHIDGSQLELTPERAVQIQELLGADCIM